MSKIKKSEGPFFSIWVDAHCSSDASLFFAELDFLWRFCNFILTQFEENFARKVLGFFKFFLSFSKAF